MRRDRNVKMVNVLSPPEGRIQFDRRFVTRIGLNKDHPRLVSRRLPLQMPNKSSGYASSPVHVRDSQVIDVDFAARLFELLKNISREAADDLLSLGRTQHEYVVLTQEMFQV